MEILYLRLWDISYLSVIYTYRIGKFSLKVILIY